MTQPYSLRSLQSCNEGGGVVKNRTECVTTYIWFGGEARQLCGKHTRLPLFTPREIQELDLNTHGSQYLGQQYCDQVGFA
jgi:hypothetical protein